MPIALMVSTSYAANAALYKLSYDPLDAVTPIVMVGEIGNMVTVNPSGPFRSVEELIAYAKANPGRINFASGGTGSGNHLATEHFSQMAGIRMTHVPYKGSTAGVGDLISGQIQLIFSGLTGMIPHHKANRVRGIAVTSAKRSNALPDVPTVANPAGYDRELVGHPGPEGLPRTSRALEPETNGSAVADVKAAWRHRPGIVGGTRGAFAKCTARHREWQKWSRPPISSGG